ncbi:MAG: hypothetical protein QOD06_252 [Candidatus Binatota bacterium]|nr:hypothetical protein [Candidatus Binatota bacterium]
MSLTSSIVSPADRLPRSAIAGVTFLELIGALALLTILFSIGVSSFQTARHATALSSAVEVVGEVLLRGRWMAINSGSRRIVVVSPPYKLSIQDPTGKELQSADLGIYGVKLSSAPTAKLTFDGRGFLSPTKAISITLTNPQDATKTVTVLPLGRIQVL